jgi:hypothetical protein
VEMSVALMSACIAAATFQCAMRRHGWCATHATAGPKRVARSGVIWLYFCLVQLQLRANLIRSSISQLMYLP